MTNYSLRARMMILILAPTVLIGLLLSIFFVAHRYNDLQRQLEDAGASIIEPLAVSSEYGMNLQNRESIGQLISVLHRRHSEIVRAISVYDSHNRLFVTSNYQLNPSELQIPKGEAFPRHLSVIRDGDMMILRTPIVSESYSPDESPESDAKMPGNMLGYVALELDLKSVRLQQYKEIFISSVMMLFCIGIALIFGWRLMRDVTGPIRNMVNTVDRIRRGQLDSRVEGFMLGELDMLKNGINSMAMSLAAYHEEMQHNVDQATSDLRETLEQMEIQNVELDLAKKRAQEAARIKSEFLANMSHELRTPLNGVIGFTRLTLKTDLNATQRDHLTTIERSANNLLAIINDVLDFSKLEAGKLILESIPFLLRTSLDEVVTLLAHSAHDKGLELTLNIKNNVPDNVIGDPLRLQQIVTNLVGNAIKFTEHGNIDVLVEQRAISNSRVQIEIQIHDTGIGIPERDQSRLFQAFRQADASISRRHGGTGLGLVITQRLVKEMGGDISFHSQPNRGSTFWFHISLDLNPNAIPDTLNTDGLVGKRLAYVEANATAAQCTLEMLAATPLEVIYSPTFSSLAEAQYDILLVGIPVSMRDLSPHREKLAKACAMSDNVLLALPCHAQVSAEALKRDGVAACLLKPLTTPGTTRPLAILDLGAGSTDASIINAQGEISATHLAGAGDMVTMIIARELGLEDRYLAEEIKKYPLAKVESLFHLRHEDGSVQFFPSALPPAVFARVCVVKPDELVPLPGDLPLEKVRAIRRSAKSRVFVTNALRALRQVSPTGNIRDIPFVVLVGGSSLDFEIPQLVTDALAHYRLVAGRGNIRGCEGPRNAVASGLLLSWQKGGTHGE